MKCLLIASESAEVLFHWTDKEYELNLQEQYGAFQEEGERVRNDDWNDNCMDTLDNGWMIVLLISYTLAEIWQLWSILINIIGPEY